LIAAVATVDELLQATDEVHTDGNSEFGPDTHAVTCRTTEDKPSTTQRQCLELEASQSEVGESAGTLVVGRGRWVSAAEVVDDADAVEADHDRQPPRHRRGLEPSDLLQPAQYRSMSVRTAASGYRSCPSHQRRKIRRSEWVWRQVWPQ
jgi:hypothetical protein